MNLEQIWSDFSSKLADIEIVQRSTKKSAQTELTALLDYEQNLSKNPKYLKHSTSLHNMSFKDLRSGDHRIYQHRELSVEERKKEILLRKNRQYQWLFAEAYEEFEDYLVKLYAYCGIANPNFWTLTDYGNIKLSEIASKDFDWHIAQAARKKNIPKSILESFRSAFPNLLSAESQNITGGNLRFSIAMAEKLRHIIVHNAGKTADRFAFIESVAKSAGVLNNGNVTEACKDEVSQFFGGKEYSNTVMLLEVRVNPEIPLDMHVCRFGILADLLLGYAYMLYEMASLYVHPMEA